jgi:DNA-binding response OmpR family regulator
MIIDDDTGLVEDMSAFLKKSGHCVMSSDSMDGAIEKLTAFKPDLLILDVMFPDDPVAGFNLVRKIRRNRDIRKLPVILSTDVNQHYPTGFSSSNIDPVWMPVQDFIDKPVDLKKLLRKIGKFLPQSAD